MGKYFKDVKTLEELRKQYKELLKVHHPDNGGSVSDMQEINAEYIMGGGMFPSEIFKYLIYLIYPIYNSLKNRDSPI